MPSKPFAVVILAVIVLCVPAKAQERLVAPCGRVIEILGFITGPIYREKLKSKALLGKELHVEFYVNAKTGTWTLISLPTPGVACHFMSGHGWADVPQGEPI